MVGADFLGISLDVDIVELDVYQFVFAFLTGWRLGKYRVCAVGSLAVYYFRS